MMRVGFACLNTSHLEARVWHGPLADALDSAMHAAVFGCGHRSCDRTHVVVIRQAERYRVQSFAPANDCECRACLAKRERARLRAREWYAQHRDRARAVQRTYREAHREECLEKSRRWQQANKQRRREYNRLYVAKQREQIRQYQRERYRKRRQQQAETSPQFNQAASSPAAGGSGYPRQLQRDAVDIVMDTNCEGAQDD